MAHVVAEIQETPADPKPFRVVVRDGALILHSKPVDSRAEGERILLRVTAGAREAGGAAPMA